jgi:hypothetical protein
MASRSRRISSRRARMVAKSSAARGLVTFPPISLVEFWWCSMAHGWRETDRKVVPEASLGLPRGHIAQFWAIKCRRGPSGWDRMGAAAGSHLNVTKGPPPRRRRHGPGVWHWRALYPCRRSAPDGLTRWLLNACGSQKARVAGMGASEGDEAHWPQGCSWRKTRLRGRQNPSTIFQ